MAMNPATSRRDLPLGAIFLGGLILVFLGERVVVSVEAARYALTGLGLLGLVASTAMRVLAVNRAPYPDLRRAERALLILSVIGLVGIGLYFMTTNGARTALGIAAMAPEKRARVDVLFQVAWVAAVLLSALPMLLGEIALTPMRRAERIESRRVRFAIRSGVTLGMAAIYCALFTFAAGELEWKLDYSYFRTSKPSESTRNIAASTQEPIEVAAFFPQLNDVGAEVETYLRELAHAAPNLKVVFYDRLLVPQIAKDKKVATDGSLILTRGESRETVSIGADMKSAGSKLKTLDQDFQKALLRVIRESRVAYFTIGHGEINETVEKETGRSAKLLKQLLERQNYSVKDLGLTQGLAVDVPADAGLVIILGPKQALTPEEVASIGRYADRGGHLLMALDPEGGGDHAPLAGIVGLTWSPVLLASDKNYFPATHQPSDHAILPTDRYSSHASVSTLSKLGPKGALIFIRTSSLDKKEGGAEKVDFAIKSLVDTFDDKNQNYELDGDEKRTSRNIAAAVTKPGAGGDKGKNDGEMRAFVTADADCFSDLLVSQREQHVLLFIDVVRWLGGEESFAGANASNEDVRIDHTKQKDVLWFYATIFGAPLLIGGLGFWVSRRRKRPASKKSARPQPKRPAPKKPAPAKKPRTPVEEEAQP